MTLSVAEYSALVAGLASVPRQFRRWSVDCLGLILAEDIDAVLPVPPFTNSAMDGYAVRARDVTEVPARLKVVGDSPAGAPTDRSVGAGEAVRIMTGAPLPVGADAIVPVEATDQRPGAAPLPQWVEIREPAGLGRHIRRAGEDVPVGSPVLTSGTRLTPAALAAAIATGHGELAVHPRPRVAVIATGSELVPPGRTPGPGQLPDSNSPMLAALVEQAGADVAVRVAVADDVEVFGRALEAAAARADLVLTTGGVSAGAFDVVKEFGGLDFHAVLMQPGRPQASGWIELDERRVPLLGLPGNPVSVFVSFHVFVAPLLAALAGDRAWERPTLVARASTAWRSPAGRQQYVPVALAADGTCAPPHALGSGSHLIASLHLADGLAIVAADVTEVAAGDELTVLLTGAR